MLAESSDPELNARALYMMAKCELNDAYNNEPDYWKTDAWYDYKKSFDRLNKQYGDTRFAEKLRWRCSWYDLYISG